MDIATQTSPNLMESTRLRIEAVLEQLYKDTSLEDQYKNEIANSFQKISALTHEFEMLSEQGDVNKTLEKAQEIVIQSQRTAQDLTELEQIEKRFSVYQTAIEITIDAATIAPILIGKQDLKTRIIRLSGVYLNLLNVIQYPMAIAVIRQGGFTNIGDYISTLLYLNDNIIERKFFLDKPAHKGFGDDIEASKELRIIQKRINQIVELIKFSLVVNQREFEDSIACLTKVNWLSYQNLSESLGDISWCRISYANETLELMAPGRNHERISDRISQLIMAYGDEYDLDYFALRSTRITKEGQISKEPDVSFAIGADKQKPDLAVEVNYTSGKIDDLEIYRRLEIKEVWMWDQKRGLEFYVLEKDGYKKSSHSYFLERISSKILEQYLDVMLSDSDRVLKKKFIDEIKKL